MKARLANLTNGGAGGNEFTSYAPMPFFISSNSYSFFNVWPWYTVFDLTKHDKVQITVWTNFITGVFDFGNSPEELIENFTDDFRMPLLQEWVYQGAIIGMQGGSEKVQDIYEKLQARNTPITAFWLQDWVGQRTTSFGKQLWWNWEVDYDRYPNWDTMVAEFEKT